MPTVSFLMSNYKTPPAFLRRALDSMLEQTFTDFEIVAINDGVRDESYELLLEYAAREPKIVLIENEQNLGLPASLNRGIERCRGKYIARMDTDDICYPDRLEQQVAYMEAHPDVMFAGAWADVFEEDETQILYTWERVMCSREEYRVRLLFANEPLLIHPTVIFRTEFLKNNGLYYSEDPQYRYAEDYEMWTRCADCGAAGILEKPVIKYRAAQTEKRITVGHAADMIQCTKNIQKKLLSRLQITSDDETLELNYHIASGEKKYDIRYKYLSDRILRQNKKHRVYDGRILKSYLRERWFRTTYHGMKEDKSLKGRVRCFLSLYPTDYLRMIRAIAVYKTRNRV